jgi:hypothetical protein
MSLAHASGYELSGLAPNGSLNQLSPLGRGRSANCRRQRKHPNPTRERGTYDPTESLAYASGWDNPSLTLRDGMGVDA